MAQCMEAEETEISRILRCPASNVSAIFSFSPGEQYTRKELRRRYKTSALLVHPDRSKFGGAETAFQILSNSLELLQSQLSDGFPEIHYRNKDASSDSKTSSEQHRCNSCNSSIEVNLKAGGGSNVESPAKRAAHTVGTNYTNQGVRTFVNNSVDRNTRLPASLFDAKWAQAEEEFLVKILEGKVSQELRVLRKKRRRNEADITRASDLEADLMMREEHAERRADGWRKWSVNRKAGKSAVDAGFTVRENTCDEDVGIHRFYDSSYNEDSASIVSNNTSSSNKVSVGSSSRCSDGNIGIAERSEKNQNIFCDDLNNPICIICQRKFHSSDALRRHEQVSELHRQNVAILRSASS